MTDTKYVKLCIQLINILNEIHPSPYFKLDYTNFIELLNFYPAVFNSMVTNRPKVTFVYRDYVQMALKPFTRPLQTCLFPFASIHHLSSSLHEMHLFIPFILFFFFNLDLQFNFSKSCNLGLELPTLNTSASSLHSSRKLLKSHMLILSFCINKIIEGKAMHPFPISV